MQANTDCERVSNDSFAVTLADLEESPPAVRFASTPIDVFFKPRSVAVIGATERAGAAGCIVLENLIGNTYGGVVYPVNPKRETVLGVASHPSVGAIPGDVDLAVFAIPAAGVPDAVTQCVAKGVTGAVVLASGFSEVGPEGAALEREVLERARAGGLRLLGPNCLGVGYPPDGLNASVGSAARAGSVGFASQSGALSSSILEWSLAQQFGFSAFMSMGSMLDVDWSEVIYFLGDDHNTRSIVLYVESIGNARQFLSAAREVALSKPVILIKAEQARPRGVAAPSAAARLDRAVVLDAAFDRSGLLRVDSIYELFSMAEVLAKQPRPRGNRLAIVTNAGSTAVLATNALVAGGGLTAELGKPAFDALDDVLPPHWSHANPIDMLGDATPERFARTIEIVASDPNVDGLLVTYARQGAPTAADIAAGIAAIPKLPRKPVLASFMGGDEIKSGVEILGRAGIPTLPYPDAAARIFNLMWRYDDNLRALLETPSLAPDEASPNRVAARALIAGVLARGRTRLTQLEAKQLLGHYEIATVPSVVATSVETAVAAAEFLGYPVALKVHAPQIRNKTDNGGVHLRVGDAAGVRRAYQSIASMTARNADATVFDGVLVQQMVETEEGYELILGSSIEQQFGPVLLFGHGGRLVDVYRDWALGLPPLTEALARRMIGKTRISAAFAGGGGVPAIDVDALSQALIRFSNLIVDHPRIKEFEINPLFATAKGVVALDAYVVLHAAEVDDAALPRTTIRPYPSQYEGTWSARDGSVLEIRPVRPEDEPLMPPFHRELSERSAYFRYAGARRLTDLISHEKLARLCFIDYAHEMVLIALRTAADGTQAVVGVGQLVMEHEGNQAEFALIVSDSFHGNGLGSELLRRLVEIGRRERVGRIVGHILADNRPMLDVSRRLGFAHKREFGGPMIVATLELA
jgi:acetyltransferase